MSKRIAKAEILSFIAAHKEEVGSKYGVRRIGIFGSYTRDQGADESDIDIVVELEKPDLFCLIGIKQFFQESLGRNVDVVRLRERMNESLKLRIQRDAVYV